MNVLVTGATAGFGKAIAEKFASEGYDVIITGRREDRLENLKKQLEDSFNVKVLPLCFDVRDKDAVKNALKNIPAPFNVIDILVNNAGLAVGRSPIDKGDIEDWDRMIDTNVKGLLYVSREIIPGMVQRKSGQIFNIGSIAGKETYPNGNVYCASKHAVDSLTKAMRTDLLQHGIKVTGICPGLAETEFSIVRYKGDKEKANLVYKDLTPLFAEDIAEVVFFAATRPAHVTLNDIVITPTAQANSFQVHRS